MRKRLLRAGPTVLLGCALLTSACSGGGPGDDPATPMPTKASARSTHPADPTSPITTPTEQPTTSSATPTKPTAVAKVNAQTVLERYFRVRDTCLNKPQRAKKSCFDDVATGTELRNNRNALANAKAYGLRQIGRISVVSVKPVKVDLTNKPKQQPPVIPTVVFTVCYDVSKVSIVDTDGKSIVPSDRINHGRHRVSVYNYGYPDQSQWRVGYSGDSVKDPSC